MLVATVVVVLGLVAAYAGARRYQPLLQVGELAASSDTQAVLVEEFEETGAQFLQYEHGEYVSYAFTVRNTGPVGVTVTAATIASEHERRLLQPVQASLLPEGGGSPDDLGAMEPLRPFALGPGEERQIVVQARFDNCEYYTERAAEVTDGHDLAFRVAGVQRTARVDFRRPLIVRSPTILGCDDRTLDRSEHRRSDP